MTILKVWEAPFQKERREGPLTSHSLPVSKSLNSSSSLKVERVSIFKVKIYLFWLT